MGGAIRAAFFVLMMLGHAGDRSDEDIRELTAGAFGLAPDHVIITEIPEYLRGRDSGEISEIIRGECLQRGLQEQQLSFSENPLTGTRVALQLVQPGDLVLLLVHSDRDAIIELLESLAD